MATKKDSETRSRSKPQVRSGRGDRDHTVAKMYPREFREIEIGAEASRKRNRLLSYQMLSTASADDDDLRSARKLLEHSHLLSKVRESMRPESGAIDYGFENIVGVGRGIKVTANEPTGVEAVTVYVVRKAPLAKIKYESKIPEFIEGVATDVVETGEFRAASFPGLLRPAPGGCSIGHLGTGSGTMTCLVRQGNALFILGSNHVMGVFNRGRKGEPIVQPGQSDGGTAPKSVLAELIDFRPITFGGSVNIVDCAIARVSPRVVTPLNHCFGRISNIPLPPARGLTVKKCGRTTEATAGVIADPSATIKVDYGAFGMAVFANQILIQSTSNAPFSAPGDSGSLILSGGDENRPMGILCSSGIGWTSANPIGEVLAALDVVIVN